VHTGLVWGNLMERDHLDDPDIDGRIILRRIFNKWDLGSWTGFIWLKIGTGGGTCKCGDEPSGSLKYGAFLVYLRTG